MEWHGIESIPQDGKEYLVCNVRQGSVLQLVSWDRVHKCWKCKGKVETHFQWTHWTPILNKPKYKGVQKIESDR